MLLVEVKKTLNTQSVIQLKNALNGKTEQTEEFTSKLNNLKQSTY